MMRLLFGRKGKALIDLSFMQSLPPCVTFSRGSSGWYFNKSGLLTQGATNGPRFDYDPSTLSARGLLIEEQRTNTLLYSSDFTNAAWSKGRSTVATGASAAHGLGTYSVITADTTSGYHACFVSQTRVSGTAYTASAYFMAGTCSYFTIVQSYADLSSSTVASTFNSTTKTWLHHGAVTPTVGYQDLGGGVFRIWQTVSPTFSGTSRVWFAVGSSNGENYAGAGTETVNIVAAQTEVGSFPTSYIPTSGATVTRATDIVKIASPSWLKAAKGTVFVKAVVPFVNATRRSYLAALTDGTSSNLLAAAVDSTKNPVAESIVAGTTKSSGGALSLLADGATVKEALSYCAGSNLFAANGVVDSVGTFGSSDLPSFNQINLGDRVAADRTLNGYLQAMSYYALPLTSGELVRVTQ